MSKGYYERRRFRSGDFEYLLDDDDRTAWIDKGCSGGARVYSLPETALVEGIVYKVTGVEVHGFNTQGDCQIEELFIPDNCEYIDELSFRQAPVKTLHIGKGLRNYHPWSFRSACPDWLVEIHPDNPCLKTSADGHMILSRDGKELVALIHDIEDMTVPEGVEVIRSLAVSCKKQLRSLHLPSTLKRIERYGIMENENLEGPIIPEECVIIREQEQ